MHEDNMYTKVGDRIAGSDSRVIESMTGTNTNKKIKKLFKCLFYCVYYIASIIMDASSVRRLMHHR